MNPQKKQKVKQVVYISAVKLIKRLVGTTCQTVISQPIISCYRTCTLWKHYENPYLTIDHPKQDVTDEHILSVFD